MKKNILIGVLAIILVALIGLSFYVINIISNGNINNNINYNVNYYPTSQRNNGV